VVAAASQGKAVCHGQPDMHFTGVYDSVEIEDCERVTLEQVHAGSLVIRRSTASVVRSTFTGGIVADASTLIITGGEVDGEVPLEMKDSKVDLAACRSPPAAASLPRERTEPLLLSCAP
jgi:hypothetical protein